MTARQTVPWTARQTGGDSGTVPEQAGRSHDDGHVVRALRPTDLITERGDYNTVTGPCGSGKSTLLNLIGLLERPDVGTCHVLGRDACGLSEAERGAMRGEMFGFVFQAFHLVPGRSVVENVELGMLYGRHPARRRRRRSLAREAITRVRLAHRADADPRTLSGGERLLLRCALRVRSRSASSANGSSCTSPMTCFSISPTTVFVHRCSP